MRPWLKRTIVWVGIVSMGTGCGVLGLEDEVEIRVRNGSNLMVDEAVLYLPSQVLEYSNLDVGEATPYSQVQKAYYYASAQVVVGQDTARIQVIDYVGETPLKGGRYTYILRVFPGTPLTLGLDFEKDS